MAPKKPTTLEHPPHPDPPSSSSEEDESDGSEEQQQQPPQPKASKKPLIHIKKPDPKPASPDASDDGSDEDESDSEPTPPALDLSKSVTVAVPPPPAAAKSSKKREADGKEYAKNFKKLKDVVDDDKKVEDDEVKKQMFKRLFSEEDEIELLKGMLRYKVEKGVNTVQDLSSFHKYVKDAIHVDVTSAQLSDKIRRLRKKYQKTVAKNKKNGVERSFGKQFEQLSYDLSKKIWGGGNLKGDDGIVAEVAKVNGGVEVKSNGKGKRTPKPNMTPDQKEKHAMNLQIPSGLRIEKGNEDVLHKHNSASSSSLSLCLSELVKSKDAAEVGLSEGFFKKGLELLGDDVKAGLEEKWKGLVVAEAELYYKRLEITQEEVKLVLDAYKASGR